MQEVTAYQSSDDVIHKNLEACLQREISLLCNGNNYLELSATKVIEKRKELIGLFILYEDILLHNSPYKDSDDTIPEATLAC